uniref:(northern house mosquito) hypothetical protein n=1 Tax=Culex pipiens TaxID=7175 RepID=A0A8D8JQV8_CULPI
MCACKYYRRHQSYMYRSPGSEPPPASFCERRLTDHKHSPRPTSKHETHRHPSSLLISHKTQWFGCIRLSVKRFFTTKQKITNNATFTKLLQNYVCTKYYNKLEICGKTNTSAM